MSEPSTFSFANQSVNRLGFGAMRITGDGIWGPPKDPDECRAVLRRAVELGVNLIDTADSYGPYVSEELIREALHPYGDVKVATKAGFLRIGPNDWRECGRPDYLRQECEMSLRRLGQESLDLFQLHRIDPTVAPEDQFGLLARPSRRGQGPGRRTLRGERRTDQRRERRGDGLDGPEPLQRHRTARAKRCWSTASVRASVSFRGTRSRPAASRAAAGRSTRWLIRTRSASASSPWRGCSVARRSCCRFPGRRKVAHVEENCAAATITLDDATFEAISALRV